MARPSATQPATSRGQQTSLRPRFRTRRILAVAATLTAAATLVACGGSDSSSEPDAAEPSTSAASSFPVTVSGADGSLTLDAAPAKIVSLSPTATEMLFAIGAGSQVTAVDDQSSYPKEAPRSELSGFQPSAEAVAKYEPDLVVYADDLNGLTKALTTLKVPALRLPAAATLDDSYAQLETLGKATGHEREAAEVISTTRTRIEKAVANAPATTKQLSVYHELDNTYYSVTSSTFIGAVYKSFGLTNIADKAPDVAGGYPQLSAEFIAQQNPGLVVLADGAMGETPETFAKRAAFGSLDAVTSKRVLVVDGDIASRWGPRVADFAESIATALKQD